MGVTMTFGSEREPLRAHALVHDVAGLSTQFGPASAEQRLD